MVSVINVRFMSPFLPPGPELFHKDRFVPSEFILFSVVISKVVELPFFYFLVPDEFPVTPL